jgi:hypothetical protein
VRPCISRVHAWSRVGYVKALFDDLPLSIDAVDLISGHVLSTADYLFVD